MLSPYPFNYTEPVTNKKHFMYQTTYDFSLLTYILL